MDIAFKVVDAGVRPVLFGFQNSIPCKEEIENASYGLFQSVDEEDTLSLIVKGDKMTLRGKGIQKPKNEKVYLGIYNTKKQEVKMMPTTGMISLVQKVNCFEPTVLETDDSLDYLKRRKMLVDVFGNKKSKQILKQRENARIEVDNVIGGKSMEAILKIKGENAPDLSKIVMKKPKKTTKPKEEGEKEKKEKKEKKTKTKK